MSYPVGLYYLREPVQVLSLDEQGNATIQYVDETTQVVVAQPERKNPLSMPVPGKSRGRAPIPVEWARHQFEVTVQTFHPLQEISDEDILKEGVEKWGEGWRNYKKPSVVCSSALDSFISLWDGLNAPGDRWSDNPVVQALEFKISPILG